jgi:hypothetical protein
MIQFLPSDSKASPLHLHAARREGQTLPRPTIELMNSGEQSEWIARHIPHRVRAAIARLPMKDSLLDGEAFINPECRTDRDKVYWRCATDSIWEGRLAATRWLIEFVGIKRNDDDGKATEYKKSKKKGTRDVRVYDLDGGRCFDPSNPNAQLLADVWKGCPHASSHATNEYNHPLVAEKELSAALTIILDHLQDTIYNRAGKKVCDCVLKPKD